MVASIIEVVVVAFLIWGLFNEEKFVDFEDKIIDRIKGKQKRVCKIHKLHNKTGNPTHCA